MKYLNPMISTARFKGVDSVYGEDQVWLRELMLCPYNDGVLPSTKFDEFLSYQTLREKFIKTMRQKISLKFLIRKDIVFVCVVRRN